MTITGSYRKHFERLIEAKRQFEALGARVLRPHAETISSVDEDLVLLPGDPDDARELQQAQLEAIAASDLLYVVNPGGYVGAAATLDVGYAHRGGTAIATSELPFEASVAALATVIGNPERALEALAELEQ